MGRVASGPSTNHTDGFTKDNPKNQLESDKLKREEVNVPSMCKGPEVGSTMDPCTSMWFGGSGAWSERAGGRASRASGHDRTLDFVLRAVEMQGKTSPSRERRHRTSFGIRKTWSQKTGMSLWEPYRVTSLFSSVQWRRKNTSGLSKD